MDRPRFRAQWRVAVPTPADVALTGEVGYHLVPGRALAAMAPHLDGTARTGDLLEDLKDAVSPPEFFFALMSGEKAGYLADAAADGGASRDELGFWDLLGADAAARTALAALRIAVTAHGDADPQPVAAALAADGLTLAAEGDADLVVAVVDDWLAPTLADANAAALAAGRPWMLVRPGGLRPGVGPILVPGETACWACLAHRLRANREVADHVERTTGRPAAALAPAVSAPGAGALIGAMAALELARFQAGAPNRLAGAMLTLDPADGAARRHTVTRRPHCPACGTPATRGWAAPGLESRPRTGQTGLDASLARLRRLVDPITGAIHSVDRTADAMDGLLHCYKAVHPFPMVRIDIRVLSENRFGRSGAAAFTEEEAELGTLGEAAERLSGVWIGEHEPRLRATRTALGDEALELADCLLYSERQMAGRAEWNPTVREARELVPVALDPDRELDWTPVWSLTDGTRRLLPSAFCYYGHPEAALDLCYSDSNGCAAGETWEHAVLAGLLELIERDAVSIWWYNRLRRPAVDLEAFDLPFVDAVRAALARRDRDLAVLDLTHDLGIPVFVAVSARSGAEAEDIMLGFGVGLDPRRGLMAALREICQMHPMVARRDARGRTRYLAASGDTVRWFREATRAAEPYLVPLDGPPRGPGAIPGCATGDVRDDIRVCLDAVRRAGIEAYVLDQTRPDIGVPVARVTAPGLRHFWRRLAPGRLYDVPVALGWRPAPADEADLNPTAIFL